jgi:4,5-DOPA dioxygenase extradiol
MMPSLFVSHGAPTLPFDECPARYFLRDLAATFGRPKAIVAVSAHWETGAPSVGAAEENATIHDFYGFPKPLYDLRYEAPGSPMLARRVAELVKGAQLDPLRGLDHGAWVPLMLAYPKTDIPVVQLSVQAHASAAHHMALGRALGPLREEDVLIMGSGGFVHNLRAIDWQGDAEPEWSRLFSSWMHDALVERRSDDLCSYRVRAPHAAMAHPTEEHLMPLFVAYGAGGAPTRRLHSSATFGSLRMDAYSFG